MLFDFLFNMVLHLTFIINHTFNVSLLPHLHNLYFFVVFVIVHLHHPAVWIRVRFILSIVLLLLIRGIVLALFLIVLHIALNLLCVRYQRSYYGLVVVDPERTDRLGIVFVWDLQIHLVWPSTDVDQLTVQYFLVGLLWVVKLLLALVYWILTWNVHLWEYSRYFVNYLLKYNLCHVGLHDDRGRFWWTYETICNWFLYAQCSYFIALVLDIVTA